MDSAPVDLWPPSTDPLDQLCRMLLWRTNGAEDERWGIGVHRCRTGVNRCTLVSTGVALCAVDFRKIGVYTGVNRCTLVHTSVDRG